MFRINEIGDTAVLSLSQLHDVLADKEFRGVDPAGEFVDPGCFDLDEEAKKHPEAVAICNRLNDLYIEFAQLDSDFHDKFGCC
jgi:hypothetical protein